MVRDKERYAPSFAWVPANKERRMEIGMIKRILLTGRASTVQKNMLSIYHRLVGGEKGLKTVKRTMLKMIPEMM